MRDPLLPVGRSECSHVVERTVGGGSRVLAQRESMRMTSAGKYEAHDATDKESVYHHRDLRQADASSATVMYNRGGGGFAR